MICWKDADGFALFVMILFYAGAIFFIWGVSRRLNPMFLANSTLELTLDLLMLALQIIIQKLLTCVKVVVLHVILSANWWKWWNLVQNQVKMRQWLFPNESHKTNSKQVKQTHKTTAIIGISVQVCTDWQLLLFGQKNQHPNGEVKWWHKISDQQCFRVVQCPMSISIHIHNIYKQIYAIFVGILW